MTPNTKLTKREALAYLLSEVQFEFATLGDDKLIFGTSSRYVEAKLDAPETHNHYNRIQLTLWVNDVKSNTTHVKITNSDFWPPRSEWSNPTYDPRFNAGAPGFYDGNAFYVCVPNKDEVSDAVEEVIAFWMPNLQQGGGGQGGQGTSLTTRIVTIVRPWDHDFIKRVGETLTAIDWPATFEFPGYLEAGNSEGLSIAIGPATDGSLEWTADYIRDGVNIDEWAIPFSADADVEIVANAIYDKLMTFKEKA